MVREELPFNTKNYCTKLVSVYEDDISLLLLRPLNILWNEGIKSNIMNPPPSYNKSTEMPRGEGFTGRGGWENFWKGTQGRISKSRLITQKICLNLMKAHRKQGREGGG
jgi:hypothetical protein